MASLKDELFGIRKYDRVKYIGNDENSFAQSIFDREGTVVDFHPPTGEIHVALDELNYSLCFFRYEILLLENEPKEKVEFEGALGVTPNISIEEMRSYLEKYHSFVEGKDFSITTRGDTREVFLTNNKYIQLYDEIKTVDEVNQTLIENTKSLFYNYMNKVTYNDNLTMFFKVSDWTFRTHIFPTDILKMFFSYHGVKFR